MHVLAIRHVHFEDLGTLESVVAARGGVTRYLDAGTTDLGAFDPLDPDLLVVLGGPIGAGEDDLYPFLAAERRILAARMNAGRPTLGICLGAQLMALVLGARVYPGPAKEIGWAPIRLTAAGAASPLAPLAEDGGVVLHWHGDTFDLPVDAVRLASSHVCENQAFAFGPAALALQFHAEAAARALERWYIGHACEIAAAPGVSVDGLRANTARHGAALERRAARCFAAWLTAVGL